MPRWGVKILHDCPWPQVGGFPPPPYSSLPAVIEQRIPAILNKTLRHPNWLGCPPLRKDVKRWDKRLLSAIRTYGLGYAESGHKVTPR